MVKIFDLILRPSRLAVRIAVLVESYLTFKRKISNSPRYKMGKTGMRLKTR